MTEKILKITLRKSATLFFVAIFVFSTGFNLSMPFVAYGDDSTETPVQLISVEEVESDKVLEEVVSEESLVEESTDVVLEAEGETLGEQTEDLGGDAIDNGGATPADDEAADPTEPLLPIRGNGENMYDVCIDGNDMTWTYSRFSSPEGQEILNADENDNNFQGHCEKVEEVCYADMIVTSNGSELVDDGPATSVATWVHPGWTASIPGATWVWETLNIVDPTVDTTKLFTKYFVLPGVAQTATLKIATDNSYKVSINSNSEVYVDGGEYNFTAEGQDTYTGDVLDMGPADLVDYLNEGGNTFDFEVKNWGLPGSTPESNPAGLLYELNIHYKMNSCDDDNEDPFGYLTVNKIVSGGDKLIKDFPLFVDEELVTSGGENEFSVGTHYVSEDNLPGYTATFSGACTDANSDGIAEVNITEGNKHVCTITNTFEEEGGYCGDGKINQNWEACDGGESCTQTCQFEDQCTDKVFARIVVENVINDSPETGDVTDNIYLGGNENPQMIPNGTWFPIFDGTNFIVDTRTTGSAYFDVPGVAVQRLHNTENGAKLVAGIYGHDLGGDTLEHVDGYVEFSNNITPISLIDGSGSLHLENGFDGTGFGGTDHNNDEVFIDGDLTKFSLGTMSKGDAFAVQLSEPVSCDGGYCGDRVVNQDWEACDGGENCTQTCQFEDQCTDKAFARITIDNVIKDPAEDGNITSNIFLGGASDPEIIPSGTWFMIFDGVNFLTDIRTGAEGSSYFNVPGVAVQRLYNTENGGKIVAGIYGHDLGGDTLEHVDGTLEFSGNTGATAIFNGSGSLGLENGFDGTGFGGVDHNNDEVRLNGDSVEFSLGTMSKGDAFTTSYSNPVSCDDNGGDDGEDDDGGNGGDNDGGDNGGNGGNGGSSGSTSRSSSSGSSGTVLGDNTGNGDGEVLGESLASTGTENVSYIVLSALILAFLVATKRKQSII